jgi:hypothetical protein
MWYPKALRYQISLGERRLRTGPQRDLARAFPQTDGDVRFYGYMLYLRKAEGAIDHRRALRPSRLDISLAQFEVFRDIGARPGEDEPRNLVVAKVGMEQRGIGPSTQLRVKDRWELLVFDKDPAAPLLGRLLTASHNTSHRLADESHAVPGEDGAVDEVEPYARPDLATGHHSQDSGNFERLRNIHAMYERVSVGTPNQKSVAEPVTELHVIGELR